MPVQAHATLDQLALREAFSLYPTGVVALCALREGAPVGIAVNSFTSISLDPPLVAVSIARTSTTWPLLADRRLGLSVLSAEHGGLARALASRSGDRFANVQWRATDAGAVLIDGAALWLECDPWARYDGGDHQVVLLRVEHAETFPDVAPLVFHQSRFRALDEA
ncbi:flavin reductase family protein [Ruicaihuangia caeni]|uniref:flavin reductase family protein n=1 Tax=Ruicaihuangia caeni TaxID=3042517 RepID=UPI00338FBEAA